MTPTAHPGRPGEAERREASLLVERLVGIDPSLVRVERLDLTAALEEIIFSELRFPGQAPGAGFGSPDRAAAYAKSIGRLARAAISSRRLGRRPARPDQKPILVVATAPIHLRLFEPVGAEIARLGGPPVVRVGAGSQWSRGSDLQPQLRIGEIVDERWLRRLTWHATRLAVRLPQASRNWDALDSLRSPAVRRAVADSLPRAALMGGQLSSLVAWLQPALLVAYSEVGVWSRLVPEVAHGHGIRAVDLPHAEAADPWSVAGIAYDAAAVYGPASAKVMHLAGVPDDRVVQVGSVRYDALAMRVRQADADAGPDAKAIRRIVFASQPAKSSGPMTRDIKVAALRAAVAAAAAIAPAELVVRPHPVESDSVVEDALRGMPRPGGVDVRIERQVDLHDLLPGAFMLITAWSQSVLEATIAGVPSVTVNPTGRPAPVTFAEEGLASEAVDEDSAAAAARALSAPGGREFAIARARAALHRHVGELDGRAAERSAELILRLANR